MDTHEFQAKTVLQKYEIPVPEFRVVSSISEAEKAIEELKLTQAVVKAQVHAGGRGKAGGVKLARKKEDILPLVEQMLQMRVSNRQTGKQGVVAYQLLLSPLIDFKKEFYLAAAIDREQKEAILIASPEGGMDIEETAEKNPDRVLRLKIPPEGKFHSYQLLRLVKFMGWSGSLALQGQALIAALVKAFKETDASLLEINPLVETSDGQLLALDAKLSIDDNALFRQPAALKFYDPKQLNRLDAQAREFDLAYVALDGEIGCMVNGAGLAMATMDIIRLYGGSPANFLDVGGGASQEKVAEGFKILLADPQVKAILVNIFGGIMNCATLAAGIISAAKQTSFSLPLIVRMEGTHVEQGKKALADSGLEIILADNLAEAAQKATAAIKI